MLLVVLVRGHVLLFTLVIQTILRCVQVLEDPHRCVMLHLECSQGNRLLIIFVPVILPLLSCKRWFNGSIERRTAPIHR